jgi:hypothetical protein
MSQEREEEQLLLQVPKEPAESELEPLIESLSTTAVSEVVYVDRMEEAIGSSTSWKSSKNCRCMKENGKLRVVVTVRVATKLPTFVSISKSSLSLLMVVMFIASAGD